MTTYVVTDYDGWPNITAGKRYKAIRCTNLFFTIYDDVNSPTSVPREDHSRWTVIEEPDTPKTWGEMTDAEKGALLLAQHEGEVIQSLANYYDGSCWTVRSTNSPFRADVAYRRLPKTPEPVVGEVVMWGQYLDQADAPYWQIESSGQAQGDTHTLTLPTLDGTLVTGEFANEDGVKVVIKEKK